MSNSEPATQLISEENLCESRPEDISKCPVPATLLIEDENLCEALPEDMLKSPELDEDICKSKLKDPENGPEPDENLCETQPEDISKDPEPTTREIDDENFCETQAEDIFKGPGPATLLLEDANLGESKPKDPEPDENLCQTLPEETLKSPELDDEHLDESKPEDNSKPPGSARISEEDPCESMPEETFKDPMPTATLLVPDENPSESMPEETSKDPEPAATQLISDENRSQSIPEDIFKCPFCRENYDLELRVQKVLNPCGHYLCLKCLKNIFFNGSLQGRHCPTCKSFFSPTRLAPEDFPTNLSVSQILEDRARTSLGDCTEHACPRKLFCITDQVPVCKYCPEYGEHKGHQVQLIKVLKDKTEKKRERLNELLVDNVEKKQKREQEIEDSANKMQEFLIDQFMEMESLLQTKEEEISEQIKNVLKIESELVINACNENQTLLESKIAGITQEISQNEYGFLTRDASDEENDDTLLEENNSLEAETEEILDRFLKAIDSLKPEPKRNEVFTQTSEELPDTLLQCEQKIPKVAKPQPKKAFKSAPKESQEPMAKIKAEEHLSPTKEINFSLLQEKNDAMEEEFGEPADQLHVTTQEVKTSLTMETEPQISNKSLYDRISERTATKAKIEETTAKLAMETEPQVSNKSLYDRILERTAAKTKIQETTTKITMETEPQISNKSLYDRILKRSATEAKIQPTMEPDISKPFLSNAVTKMEIEDIKTQLTTETEPQLKLDVSNKILSDEIFNDLCSETLWNQSFKTKIHHLEVDFSASSLTDQQFTKFIKNILADLKNLTFLVINLAGTKISNESIQVFSQKALKNYRLKNFKLNCSKTSVDDEGIHSLDTGLNSSIQTLENLEIILDSTEIEGNKFLQALSGMTQLKHLKLSLDNSQVSSDIVASIVLCLRSLVKNLESLDLNFNGTDIEDKSLEGFSDNAVSQMENLKHFKLALGDTFISEDFLEEFFQSLTPLVIHLVTLELDLHFTELTNAAFKQFCEGPLRIMVNLETLKLDFSQTRINDASLKYMLLLLSKLKSFTLNLSETSLSDASLEAFKENNSFESLQSLNISLEKTQISDYTIQDFFNHIKEECGSCHDLQLTPILEGVFPKPEPKITQSASNLISKYSSSIENHPAMNDENKPLKNSKKASLLEETTQKEMLLALKKAILVEIGNRTAPRNITSAKLLEIIQNLELERYNKILRKVLNLYLPISEGIPQDLSQWRRKIKTWIQSTVKTAPLPPQTANNNSGKSFPQNNTDPRRIPLHGGKTALQISEEIHNFPSSQTPVNDSTKPFQSSQKINKEALDQKPSEKVFSKAWLQEYGQRISLHEKLAEILKGMKTQSFPVLYEEALKTMRFMKDLFHEYKDWELPTQTTCYWWYGAMGKEKELGDLWRKLPPSDD